MLYQCYIRGGPRTHGAPTATYGPGAPPYKLLKSDGVPNRSFPPRNGCGALDLTRLLMKQTLAEDRRTSWGIGRTEGAPCVHGPPL
jgi:hypothetical protein